MTSSHQPHVAPDVIDECKALTRAILPELDGTPLYYLPAPEGYPKSTDTNAFTFGERIDVLLYEAIVTEQGWRGPGKVIVYCRPADRRKALGSTLHELAHGPMIADAPRVTATEEAQANHFAQLKQLLDPPFSVRDLPPFDHDHGFVFVRKALHLHHRAWEANYEIGLPEINVAGFAYDMSPAWKYRCALQGELRRLERATMEEIVSEKPPKEFTQLFLDDYDRFCTKRRRWEERASQREQNNVAAT